MTQLPALLIEAFTEVPCRGNGAAVVLLPQAAETAWMQAIARSLNQSETAFLLHSDGCWMLRWFTPSCEVPLCGHATLAAVLALKHWNQLDATASAQFQTRSGILPVSLQGAIGQIELPAAPLQEQPLPPGLVALLEQHGLGPAERFWRSSIGYCVALLSRHAPLAELQFNPAALAAGEAQGLVLMQAAGARSGNAEVLGRPADFQLRFFAPGLGIPEDPVTGSAHALVAPFWMQTCGRSSVVGWQCSPKPGGMVCEAGSSGMIRLSGAGSVLWQGEVLMPLDASGSASEGWRQACCGA